MWEGAPENDSAVVTRLRYGGVTVLLTSDISCAGEAWALASGADLKSTALKVAHHGSGSSSCEPFLKAVKPAVAVVQAGARNVYGHPHEEALARLRAVLSNENIFITKDRGDVTLVTDGTRLWVETER
jgi:competence protein ComEC